MKLTTSIGVVGVLVATTLSQGERYANGSIDLPGLAIGSNLPKVGVVRDRAMGAGCSYWLPGDRSAAPIFVLIGGEKTLMNFDGRDINLKSIGKRSTQRDAPELYATKDLKIKLIPRFVKQVDYSQFRDAQIVISNGTRSKTIKATGVCGC